MQAVGVVVPGADVIVQTAADRTLGTACLRIVMVSVFHRVLFGGIIVHCLRLRISVFIFVNAADHAQRIDDLRSIGSCTYGLSCDIDDLFVSFVVSVEVADSHGTDICFFGPQGLVGSCSAVNFLEEFRLIDARDLSVVVAEEVSADEQRLRISFAVERDRLHTDLLQGLVSCCGVSPIGEITAAGAVAAMCPAVGAGVLVKHQEIIAPINGRDQGLLIYFCIGVSCRCVVYDSLSFAVVGPVASCDFVFDARNDDLISAVTVDIAGRQARSHRSDMRAAAGGVYDRDVLVGIFAGCDVVLVVFNAVADRIHRGIVRPPFSLLTQHDAANIA